ncbi:MAG: PQQ-dependent sugar dehydrogenase [Cyclobacteriaceae bacterium]|nr:PQQ-dependent sugar dehydrogenase [Cyclobacteriaceae bacterium]
MFSYKILFFIIGSLFFLVNCSQPREQAAEEIKILPDRNNGGIVLPEKFGALVVADTLGRGRHLAVNENGDVYVHLGKLTDSGHGIMALRDTDGDGRADRVRGYGTVPGTGIQIHNGYLYFSSRTEVYRAEITGNQLLPVSSVDTLVHMVDGSGHMEKTFSFDNAGNMYVNIGSASNACQQEQRTKGSPGIDPCVELETRAGIWKFSEGQLNQQQSLDKRYATGIRNAVALSWNSGMNKLYALQHGRDDLHRYWPEYYTEEDNLELPAEEFLDIEEGDDFGWPYCYYDPIREQKLMNPEYGGDGETIGRCDTAKNPLLGLPGHWGPNDLLFYKGDLFPARYKNGAFVAFHGSWNRLGHEQQGYNVVFIPMEHGLPAGDWEVFADGFIGAEPIENSSDAEYRPCGLAEGPDGSLYVADSQHGRIWRILYYADGIPGYGEKEVAVVHEPHAEKGIDESLTEGKQVYDMYCMVCHMSNGKGAPGMNPPLIDTEYVLGDKERLIKIILNGMSDPIEINGEIYQNIMAPHSFLTDQQIADVLTFVRKSWGNDASAIPAEEVAEVRANNNP